MSGEYKKFIREEVLFFSPWLLKLGEILYGHGLHKCLLQIKFKQEFQTSSFLLLFVKSITGNLIAKVLSKAKT